MKNYADKDTLCRNCNHQRFHHTMYSYIMKGFNTSKYIFIFEYIPCLQYLSGGVGSCNCGDFYSIDNLEYLEKKYEEKQK